MTRSALVRRHLFVGWLAITVFIALGIALEALHGFKVGFLLDVENDTRRMMWSLAHAHGTLLGLVNLALAFTALQIEAWAEFKMSLISRATLTATLFLPAGFFLGGLDAAGGDPGLGILLVPPGGLLLLGAAALVTHAIARSEDSDR